MANKIKIGTLVRLPNDGILCRVCDISSDGSFVKLKDWAYGYNYLNWFSVSCLVYVGNDDL